MIKGIVYWGLPQQTEKSNDLTRYRVTNNTVILSALLAAPFLVRAIHWGIDLRIIALSLSEILLVLSFLSLRWCRSPLVGVHFALSGIALGTLGAVYSNGGFGHVASGWLYVLPLFAGLMGGVHAGMIWTGFSLVSIAAFWIASTLGIILPVLTPGPDQASFNKLQQLMQFLAIAGCMLAYLYQVKEVDDALLGKINHLNQEVADRKKAELDAFAASRTKSEFLASMSHELRTPLNSVIGFSERLIRRRMARAEGESLEGDREYDALRSIHNNGKNLLEMINGLLSLSKIEADQESLIRSPINLPLLLNSLVDEFQAVAHSHNLVLENTLTKNAEIYADESKIKQIFVNLISNALKYTDKGRVEISGFTGLGLDGGNQISVCVKDTGIGISEEEQAQLFDPYFDKSSRKQGDVKVLGLGLPITKRLVELHDGVISVSSVVGRGSEFTVCLPEVCLVSARPEIPVLEPADEGGVLSNK